MTKNYWVSWRHPDKPDDLVFEYEGPWWISGYGDGYTNICAAMHGINKADILKQVSNLYVPIEVEMRFCEERADDWSPFAPRRFASADWMVW